MLRFIPTDRLASGNLSHSPAKLAGVDFSRFHIQEKTFLAIFTHVIIRIHSHRPKTAISLFRILAEYHTAHIK